MTAQHPSIRPSSPITSVPLAVVDVETTGLRAALGDRVCEVAVLRTGPRGEEDTFSSLVNPGRPIGAGASRVNGIRDEDVADAPDFSSVADTVTRYLDGAVLVAHNAPFDMGFLTAEYAIARATLPELPVLDTLALARGCFRFRRNRLGDVARAFGVQVGRGHRAEADVWTTYRIFQCMVDALAGRGIVTLGDLLRAQGGAVPARAPAPVRLPDPLGAAVRDGKRVVIRYADGRGRTTERLVRPLSVNERFLVAQCQLRHAQRTFRLDRILAAWWPDR